MKLFLDCEFTQLKRDTKLISLALVSEAVDEFYVELTDTYLVEDCSDFVILHVLPSSILRKAGNRLSTRRPLSENFWIASMGRLRCVQMPQSGIGISPVKWPT